MIWRNTPQAAPCQARPKEGHSTKSIPKQDPKPQRQVTPCLWLIPIGQSCLRQQISSLQGTADKHFSHGTPRRAYKTSFVSGQNHRNNEAQQRFHKSAVTHVAVSHYAGAGAAQGTARSHGPAPRAGNALPSPLLSPITLPDGNHHCCTGTQNPSVRRDTHARKLSGTTMQPSNHGTP